MSVLQFLDEEQLVRRQFFNLLHIRLLLVAALRGQSVRKHVALALDLHGTLARLRALCRVSELMLVAGVLSLNLDASA